MRHINKNLHYNGMNNNTTTDNTDLYLTVLVLLELHWSSTICTVSSWCYWCNKDWIDIVNILLCEKKILYCNCVVNCVINKQKICIKVVVSMIVQQSGLSNQHTSSHIFDICYVCGWFRSCIAGLCINYNYSIMKF